MNNLTDTQTLVIAPPYYYSPPTSCPYCGDWCVFQGLPYTTTNTKHPKPLVVFAANHWCGLRVCPPPGPCEEPDISAALLPDRHSCSHRGELRARMGGGGGRLMLEVLAASAGQTKRQDTTRATKWISMSPFFH